MDDINAQSLPPLPLSDTCGQGTGLTLYIHRATEFLNSLYLQKT